MDNIFRDPVCGMDVTSESAAGKSEYKDDTYFFCSAGCKKAFDQEPEKYLVQPERMHAHLH